ncbi:hypothetical protein WA158_000060 [Blastocystis sp. Blastoise]
MSKRCRPFIITKTMFLLMISLFVVNIYCCSSLYTFLKDIDKPILGKIKKFTGIWLNYLWAFSVLFCTRNTIWQHILHLNHLNSLIFHRFIGTTTYIVNKWNGLSWETSTQLWIYISPAVIFLLITSLYKIRRYSWEFFYIVTTWINKYYYGEFITIVDALVDHGIIRLDLIPRGNSRVTLPLPVSKYEYHPFTVAEVTQNRVILHIKPCDRHSWTQKLYTYINTNKIHTNTNIYIEGPYGEMVNVNQERDIIYIGAGVGFAGISYSILNTIDRYDRGELPNLKNIDIYLTLISDEHLYWYSQQLMKIKKCSIVHLHIYITFSKSPERRITTFKNKSKGKFIFYPTVESPTVLEFSIGRMDTCSLLAKYSPDIRHMFYICAPPSLYSLVCDHVYTNLTKSVVYSDPFEM